MKLFLRTFFLLTMVGYSFFVNAQTGACGATDILVQNVRQVGTGCTYRFDVAFTLTGSQGNKYVFFQTYLPGQYNNYFQCNQTTHTSDVKKPPELADFINQPILNVAIDVSGATPVYTTYLPDPRVQIRGIVSGPGGSGVETVAVNDGKDTRYILTNLEVTLPTCTAPTPQIFITDIFATNAASANQVQCVTCGLRFAAGFVRTENATLFADCNSATYLARLYNNTSEPISARYRVFADLNANGFLTIESGLDVEITFSVPITIPANGYIDVAGTIPSAYLGLDLFLVLDLINAGGQTIDARTVIFIPARACGALPVHFKAFNAVRKNQDVQLTWETATEDNNRGFYVQRNNGNGWKDIGFVASKATDGNSTSDLSYLYTDLNNTSKGVTQYRIMQVDIDGKAKLSEVRQVRGLAQAGKVTVYPNPSATGNVNVVFEDSKTAWNVSVSDMNGRTIKQYKGISNSILIDKLLPGMYMIRIVDALTGAQTNEKVIINNY
jgi:hypothetical protein